jgi:hypothetical protein
MGEEKKCPLFRRPESLSIGKGIGYCDMDSNITTCEGDVRFCDKTEALKRYLRTRIDKMKEKEEKKKGR